jgi:hypothetical protein
MYERTRIALQQGRAPALGTISGIINGVILENMRCLSDRHPAWLGVRPEDRWVPFLGIDTDPIAKVVRCRTKEETFSLLDYSNNTYKTETLCRAAAEDYINILIESWKLNGIHFNRNEWPNPSCTYCVRGDDPAMNRSIAANAHAHGPTTWYLMFPPNGDVEGAANAMECHDAGATLQIGPTVHELSIWRAVGADIHHATPLGFQTRQFEAIAAQKTRPERSIH